jgi:hypothetical protein
VKLDEVRLILDLERLAKALGERCCNASVPGRAAALCRRTSDVDLLHDFDGVIDLHALLANGALDLRVQDAHRLPVRL